MGHPSLLAIRVRFRNIERGAHVFALPASWCQMRRLGISEGPRRLQVCGAGSRWPAGSDFGRSGELGRRETIKGGLARDKMGCSERRIRAQYICVISYLCMTYTTRLALKRNVPRSWIRGAVMPTFGPSSTIQRPPFPERQLWPSSARRLTALGLICRRSELVNKAGRRECM